MEYFKVPYFRQEKWYTCGPACLRMLLAFFGINASEEEIEKACETTELGTTSTQIVSGASKFNVELVAIKNATLQDIKKLLEKNPVIVLIDPSHIYGGIEGFGHFIILVGLENDEIIYHDPDILDGEFKRCAIQTFLKAWSAHKNWIIGVEK